ncbi:hypothetical protein BOTBODRAFT_28295 [Botryobasidium botryosum FD-172 SS1]|uniref:ferric-chelate reductase (NADPH) n=1 Tax=Botryobasidium botryosum (strain FD-172 SS1) TaxID=930990 RepID=A0A067MSU2_BOTB1|nr:hypothetical protein BOTBODRAFT_28295 [Botryobasidium botryosum FD-172 SS1]
MKAARSFTQKGSPPPPYSLTSFVFAMTSTSHAPAPTMKTVTASASAAAKQREKEQPPDDLWRLLVVVIGLLILYHVYTLISTWVRTRRIARRSGATAAKAEGESVLAAQSGKVSLRRLPLSALSALRIAAFRWSPPLSTIHHMCLSEMTFVAGYIIALLALCFVNSHHLSASTWTNRAADLATSQIPLVVALSGKNNILSFLTGVGTEKLNVLHRAAARSLFILACVHVSGHVKMGVSTEHIFIRWGITAFTSLCLIVITSLRPIRNLAYEAFHTIHIVLVFLCMLAICIHRPGNAVRIWPGFIIWGLDRFARVIRTFFLSRVWLKIVPRKAENRTEISNVKLEQLSSDTVRVTMRLPQLASWKAGQHFYLSIPSVSALPFESHPFSAASIASGLNEKELVFIIRAREGFTRRLLERAQIENSLEPASKPALSAYVDGPYGCPPSWGLYDTCVLISGGSGITYTLSTLLEIIYQAQMGTSAVRRVVFVWMIRDADQMNWIRKTLTAALLQMPQSLAIDIRIFVTRPPAQGHTTNSIYDMPNMQLKSGRPNVKELLREELDSAPGPVGVGVCGPTPLVQDVRSALSSDIAGPMGVLKGRPTVSLHVEAFGW